MCYYSDTEERLKIKQDFLLPIVLHLQKVSTPDILAVRIKFMPAIVLPMAQTSAGELQQKKIKANCFLKTNKNLITIGMKIH